MGLDNGRGITREEQERALADLVDRRFPMRGFSPEKSQEVIRIIKRSEKAIRKKFGDRFIGIALLGSWSKGTGAEGSDLDFKIVGRNLTPRLLKKAGDIIYEEANFGRNPLGKFLRLLVKNKPFINLVSKKRLFPFRYLERYYTHRTSNEHIDADKLAEYVRKGSHQQLADLFCLIFGRGSEIKALRASAVREIAGLPDKERIPLIAGIQRAWMENVLTISQKGRLRFEGVPPARLSSVLSRRGEKFKLPLEA